jgi:hypothetical protein
MPMVGCWTLPQCSVPGQTGLASSQNARQVPSNWLESTHSELGAQSAVGLHAASGGVVPAGRQPMSELSK